MRVILDTGAFYHPAAWLRLAGATVVVPAVVYAERMRQLRRDGRDVAVLDEILAGFGAIVEPFTQAHARRIPGLADPAWRRMARDAMVACHVGPEDLLWTTDPSDFLAVGLVQDQILALA